MQNEPECVRRHGIALKHRYDEESGWCLRGCGARADGRVTTPFGGIVLEPGEYRDEPLDLFDHGFGRPHR